MSPPAASSTKRAREYVGGLWQRLGLWHCKRQTRWTLRDLTDDQLRDIGLTRREAMAEVRRSYFWD
jgi:uncharacterized protein YjiS (DUF1127 family)